MSGLSLPWRKAPASTPDVASETDLLHRFLDAATEQEADRALEDLLRHVIGPRIRRVLHHRLPEEAEEHYSLAAARVVQRLRACRANPSAFPLRNLSGFAVAVTETTIDQALRARHPERARLKNRLRYLMEHSPRFALWEDEGSLVCGRVEHQGRPALTVPETIVIDAALDEPSACLALFTRLGGPLLLHDLVRYVAQARGLQSQPHLETELYREDGTGLSPLELAPDATLPPERQLLQRETLTRLWAEIRNLPERQRAALLLNFRDPQGHGLIELLLTQVPQGEIEAAAGLSEAEAATLWDQLPLDDNQIAARLGITRQQVINLRKVARERLARRTKPAQETP